MKSFIRHVTNIFNVFLPVTRFFKTRSFLLKISGVTLGENAKVCGGGLVYGRGNLVIGNDSWISPRSTFYTHSNSIIKIGKCCDIGPEVRFITGSHKLGCFDRRAGEGFSSSIIIEDGCWIGAGVTILCGVTIGEGSVIAAGAVVTRNVPTNSLFAGVPAQHKKDLQ